MPKAIIIAGPNGAGKTTLAREFLPNEAGIVQFVNADLIAAGLSPFDPASANVAAGRAMLRRLEDLVSMSVDFALETTLSGRWLANQIPVWQSKGYAVTLYYVSLPSVELTLERIAKRVQNGGHNIPEHVARRRFGRSRQLFDTLYQDLVDDWSVWDNQGDRPVLVERSDGNRTRHQYATDA